MTTRRRSSPPFVLACAYCDAGDRIKNKEGAIAKGWVRVARDVTGLSWNDIGVCPKCQPGREWTPPPKVEDVAGQMEMFA